MWNGDDLFKAVLLGGSSSGTGGDNTTTDVFYTADGQVFTDVDGAMLHVRKGVE